MKSFLLVFAAFVLFNGINVFGLPHGESSKFIIMLRTENNKNQNKFTKRCGKLKFIISGCFLDVLCVCVTYVELNESFLRTMANDNVDSENVKSFVNSCLCV